MGEYVNYNGNQIKLGVCEDLDYVNFYDYCRMLSEGKLTQVSGNEKPADYIQGPYRFRFPFPECPGVMDNGPQMDDCVSIIVPKELGLGTDLVHRDMIVTITPAGVQGGGFNMMFPCPYDEAFTLKTSGGKFYNQSSITLSISQQRPLEGLLWTVLGCGFCGTKVRITGAEAIKLTEHIRSQHTGNMPDDKFWNELCLEILKGYASDNHVAKMLALGWIEQPAAVAV